MEEDLYDDIFDTKGVEETQDLDQLYDNIHIPEVAETAITKAKVLEEENAKIKAQAKQLKEQLAILTTVNKELKEANSNLERSLHSLVETSRVEINRKKAEIARVNKELEESLNARGQRNLSLKEIEAVLARARPAADPHLQDRLTVRGQGQAPLAPTRLVSGIRVPVAAAAPASPLHSSIPNRQFVKRKRGEVEAGGKRVKGEVMGQKGEVMGQKRVKGMEVTDIMKYSGKVRKPKADTPANTEGSRKMVKPVVSGGGKGEGTGSHRVKEVSPKPLAKEAKVVVIKDERKVSSKEQEKAKSQAIVRETILNEKVSLKEQKSLKELAEKQKSVKEEKSLKVEKVLKSAKEDRSRVEKSEKNAEKVKESDVSKKAEKPKEAEKSKGTEKPKEPEKTKKTENHKEPEKSREAEKLKEPEKSKEAEKLKEPEKSKEAEKVKEPTTEKSKEPEAAPKEHREVTSRSPAPASPLAVAPAPPPRPPSPEELLFAIHPEDELDFEAEEDEEEEETPAEDKPSSVGKSDKDSKKQESTGSLKGEKKLETTSKSRDVKKPELRMGKEAEGRGLGARRPEGREGGRPEGREGGRSRSPRVRRRSRSGARTEARSPEAKRPARRNPGDERSARKGVEDKRPAGKSPEHQRYSGRGQEDKRSARRSPEVERSNRRSPEDKRSARRSPDRRGRERSSRNEEKNGRREEDKWERRRRFESEERRKIKASREGGEREERGDEKLEAAEMRTNKDLERKTDEDLDEDLLELDRKRRELLEQMAEMEEGEVEEEKEGVRKSGKKTIEEVVKAREGGGGDLRDKLRKKVSASPGDGGSDKENAGKEEVRGEVKQVKVVKEVKVRREVKEVKVKEEVAKFPSLLREYSTEDIDHKLIPFKKRQFKELQCEAEELKKQIALRSGSTTPQRSVSESSGGERRVSPIKLSLRDVVIEPPSSSSSSLPSSGAPTTPTPSSLPSTTLPAYSDDNAVFPSSLNSSQSSLHSDLAITDESEAELSPVKRPRLAPLDTTSPHAISSLLRSPLLTTSLLSTSNTSSPTKRKKKKHFGRSVTQVSH